MEDGERTTTINDYLTYCPARACRERFFSSSTSTTNPKNPRDLVGVEINAWEKFADSVQEESKKALARESEVKLPPLVKKKHRDCLVGNEARLESVLDRHLFVPLTRLLRTLGVVGEFYVRPPSVILDPDWSWRSRNEGPTSTDEVGATALAGDRVDKILIEVKTFWALDAPDDLVQIIKSELSSPSSTLSLDSIGEKAVRAVSQVYGYLSINHLQYGVLCTYNKFFFMRRPEVAAGSNKLEITGAILQDQTREKSSFTLMEAWLTIIMAAEHNYVITSPHVSPAGKVSLPKKPMELFGGLKLGDLYLGERRTRSQLGVIVDGGLRGDDRETILKIVDTCNSADKGEKLEVEVSAYRALKELQAEIIPKVIGFFMIHGWVMVLVLQKCGKKIEGCQFGEHYQQIISMVKQIHTGGVAHGDIALRNILIDTEGKLTIIDFSEARLRSSCSEEEFLACCKEDLDAVEYLFQSHPPKN